MILLKLSCPNRYWAITLMKMIVVADLRLKLLTSARIPTQRKVTWVMTSAHHVHTTTIGRQMTLIVLAHIAQENAHQIVNVRQDRSVKMNRRNNLPVNTQIQNAPAVYYQAVSIMSTRTNQKSERDHCARLTWPTRISVMLQEWLCYFWLHRF